MDWDGTVTARMCDMVRWLRVKIRETFCAMISVLREVDFDPI